MARLGLTVDDLVQIVAKKTWHKPPDSPIYYYQTAWTCLIDEAKRHPEAKLIESFDYMEEATGNAPGHKDADETLPEEKSEWAEMEPTTEVETDVDSFGNALAQEESKTEIPHVNNLVASAEVSRSADFTPKGQYLLDRMADLVAPMTRGERLMFLLRYLAVIWDHDGMRESVVEEMVHYTGEPSSTAKIRLGAAAEKVQLRNAEEEAAKRQKVANNAERAARKAGREETASTLETGGSRNIVAIERAYLENVRKGGPTRAKANLLSSREIRALFPEGKEPSIQDIDTQFHRAKKRFDQVKESDGGSLK